MSSPEFAACYLLIIMIRGGRQVPSQDMSSLYFGLAISLKPPFLTGKDFFNEFSILTFFNNDYLFLTNHLLRRG